MNIKKCHVEGDRWLADWRGRLFCERSEVINVHRVGIAVSDVLMECNDYGDG